MFKNLGKCNKMYGDVLGQHFKGHRIVLFENSINTIHFNNYETVGGRLQHGWNLCGHKSVGNPKIFGIIIYIT